MSGIRDLIPGSVIDATMFNPCGYSMNGMKTDVSLFGDPMCRLSLVFVMWRSVVSRELTGPSTSPRSQISPMSALKPTSRRHPTTNW